MGWAVSIAPEINPECPGCALLMKRVAELQVIVEKLSAKVERLEARKPKTSRTSSKPPSSDGPWAKRPSKKSSSGKKRGAQPGHKGAQRPSAPPEEIDDAKMIKPEHCGSCSAPVFGDDPDPLRHQVIDIPPIKPHLLEFQLHRLTCQKCGAETRADLPDGAHWSNFGPNLSALIVLLSGEYRMSRRNVQRLIADSYGIDISLGAISNIERRMTDGLAGAHAEAMTSVAASPVKHLDETTWRESGELSWIWTVVGDEATVFVVRDSRGSVVAKELIGENPSGFVVSDRYSGYNFVGLDQRQVCLAHLIRDFRSMAEGEEDLRWIGERLLGLTEALFRIWHLHRAEEIDRQTLKRWARPVRERMIRLLDEGARSRGYETPGKCRGILRTESAMWTFVHEEGVEPTNNVAERALRPMVIHRKTSLGSRSGRGSDFVARMQTVAATLKRSGRSVSEFVRAVTRSVLAGEPEPTLVG